MMSTAPRSGIEGSSRAWISVTAWGMTASSYRLPVSVTRRELGDEHPRLARVVDHPVVQVVDQPPPLPGISTVMHPERLEGEVEDPDPLLVAGQERGVDHLDVEARRAAADRDGRQGRAAA